MYFPSYAWCVLGVCEWRMQGKELAAGRTWTGKDLHPSGIFFLHFLHHNLLYKGPPPCSLFPPHFLPLSGRCACSITVHSTTPAFTFFCYLLINTVHYPHPQPTFGSSGSATLTSPSLHMFISRAQVVELNFPFRCMYSVIIIRARNHPTIPASTHNRLIYLSNDSVLYTKKGH